MSEKGLIRPDIYYDRTALEQLPRDLSELLISRKLHTRGDSKKVSFVGVMLGESRTSVFLPRSSGGATKGQDLARASKILKAVNLYGENSSTQVDTLDDGEGRSGLKQLSLIFSLLDDFRENGIYRRRTSSRNINRGRIDWAKTIKRITPYPSGSAQPVYLDYHGIEKQFVNTCEVAAIHAGVIRELDERFSWLLTGTENPIAAELNSYPNPCSEPASRLKKELSATYADRDIRLLKLLIKYLEFEIGNQESGFLAGLENFHFCWEHMLGKVLLHNVTTHMNKILPAPVYIDNSGKELLADERSMRTDIILHDRLSERCTVADAKYYGATSHRDAPGWGDIVKQLFYEKALGELDEIECDIKNAFIFPGVRGILSEAKIRDRVKSTPSGSVFVSGFKPISCFYADPMDVVSHYIDGRKMIKLSESILESKSISET